MFTPFTPGSIYSTDAITVDLICCKTGLSVLGGKTSNIAFQHDGDGNEKGKKVILNRFDYQNNNFARASHFFVHFFAVVVRLRREHSC